MTTDSVFTRESDLIAQIERLKLEARDIRRRIEHARTEADKRVLNKQLGELDEEAEVLRKRLRA